MDNKFKFMFNKIESILLKMCFISILLLIGLQVIINNNDLSVFLHNERQIEKITVKDVQNKGIIILEAENKEDIKYLEVLVNGEQVKKFKGKNEVYIEVYNNDIIELNGAKCRESIKVKVTGISKNIELPKLNTEVKVCQSIEMIGKVVIK